MPDTSTEVLPNTIPDLVPDPPLDPGSIPEQGQKGQTDPKPAFLTESSPLKATREEHKRQAKAGSVKRGDSAGDNPETGMSNTLIKKEIPIPIPSPRFTVFKNDATNPNQTSKKFYNYWNELPGWAKDRLTLYVYRDWPVLVQVKEDSGEFAYIDKISGNQPLQDDIDLMNMYGTGSYKLMLSEKNCLCTVYVQNVGMNDLKSHPPADRRISDVKQVDLDHPGNKSYIEFLRMGGKLPEQQKGKEAEAEMAAISLVEKLQERNDTLVDKALTAAAAGRRDTEPTEQAITRAIDVVADGAKKSNAMLSEAYQTIKATREEGQSSATETLNLAIQLAREFAGAKDKPGDDEVVRELRARLDKIQDDRMRALEEEIKAARTAPTSAGSPFSSAKEGLSTIKEMKSMLEELGLSSKEPSPAEEIADATGMPKWMPMVLQYGAPLLNNLLNVFLVSRGMVPPPQPSPGMGGMPGGMPGMPNPGPGAFPGQSGPQPTPMPRAQQPATPQAAQPGLPPPPMTNGQAQAPAEFSPSGTPTYGLHPDIADLLFEIKTPLTQYIVSDASGDDYAPVFCDNYGLDAFSTVAGFGVEGLMSAITNYPPITTRLQALSIPLERLNKFVTEFVNYKPEFEPGQEGEDNEPGSGTTNTAA
jgi:hypothetical protein